MFRLFLCAICYPDVSVKYLLIGKQLYNHPIYWLETFVDTERFAGTCYKAANWTFLGLTSGRGNTIKPKRN